MPLSPFDYDLFMDTYLPLLHYTGVRCGILGKGTSYKSFLKKRPGEEKFECRQKLIQNESILSDYIKIQKSNLSVEAQLILTGLSKRITEKFIIYKLLTDRAIFIGNGDNFYVVYDLSDPFDQMVEEVPCVVNASIIPFGKRIVYDGFLRPYNIHLGPNMRKSFREKYQLAKEQGHLIKSL